MLLNVGVPLVQNRDEHTVQIDTPISDNFVSNQGVEVVTFSRENNVDAVVSNVTGDSPSDEGVKQIAVCLVEEVMSKAISVSKCPSVNTESIDSSELINTKKRPKIFPCPRCGKKFAQFTSSTKHCLTVVPKDVSCSICFKKMDKSIYQCIFLALKSVNSPLSN